MVVSKIMSALCAEKITLHPASHNWGTEMREYDASSGTRCARLASFGSLDNGNSPICVEDIRAPFGFSIDNGFVAGRQLSKGKVVTTKFPVVPESRIVGEIWVGGPVVSMCKELEAKCFPGSGGSLYETQKFQIQQGNPPPSRSKQLHSIPNAP